MSNISCHLLSALLAMATVAGGCDVAPASGNRPFRIQVVDDQTGRGVPLVELRTVSNIGHVTDSGGIVAFDEPGLMDREVFFFVRSHGYRFTKDGFGMEGVTLRTKPGDLRVLKIRRVNLAQRLYRVTGEGIYRDTLLTGGRSPIEHPLVNAQVSGQDSVQAAVYRGRIHWFWGDTSRAKYPLGHFQTAGAVSDLPAKGGLPPGVGVNLQYFVGGDGFSRPMAPLAGERALLVWIDGLLTVPDPSGGERLVCHYSVMKDLGHRVEHGLAVFDDHAEKFAKLCQFDNGESWRFPRGQAVKSGEGGRQYCVFPGPFPVVRVLADLDHLKDTRKYQAFTPLVPGSRYGKDAVIERDSAGKAVWGWKADTEPVSQTQERELIAAGKLAPAEARFQLADAAGKRVQLHGGSFRWNEYRKKWVMIGVEIGGTSFLGEVWYAEAPEITGPWRRAVKIVTHDRYSFYNPTQHPFFDEAGGRYIYFEGTYSAMFSGNDSPTPRYDYNQIMYRLDLSQLKTD